MKYLYLVIFLTGCSSYGLQRTEITDPATGLVIVHETGPKRLTKLLEVTLDENGSPVIKVEVEQAHTELKGVLGLFFGFLGIM